METFLAFLEFMLIMCILAIILDGLLNAVWGIMNWIASKWFIDKDKKNK